MASPPTSLTHPLEIAELAAPGGGAVGITFCPGKTQLASLTGGWARDLDLDLAAIKHWGAGILLTLVTQGELRAMKVERIGAAAKALGLRWLHLPIDDVSIPSADWEAQWQIHRLGIHSELDGRGKLLVHCKGGLGRAGTVGAHILIERGMAASAAIEAVRRVRPGAIETPAQERYVRATPQGSWRPQEIAH